ncbi:MAG: hypothetical protein QXR19_17005 [Candidatus Jordarchaeaceae archaeon]
MSSERIDGKFLARMVGEPSFHMENGKQYISFFKKVSPQPRDELDIEIYRELLKKHLKSSNPKYIALRCLDVSPEDLPPETIYEYYWSVSTPIDEIKEIFELIEKIETQYSRGVIKVVNELLEKEEMDIDDVFKLILEE